MAEERTYTPQEAAKELGVSDETIYRGIRSGTIAHTAKRVGLGRRRYTIPASEIARLKRMIEETEGNKIAHLVTA